MRVLGLTGQCDLVDFHLFKGLIQRGIDLELVLDPGSQYSSRLQEAGAKIYFHHAAVRFQPSTIAFLNKLLHENHYDIAHSFSARLLTAGLLVSKKLPIKHVVYRGTSGHLSWWDPASRMSYLNRRVDKMICVSDAVKEYFLSLKYPASKLVTIYKGHDLSWYQHKDSVSWSTFGIPENTFVLVCTANVRPVKGVDTLIQAWNLLPEDFNGRLVLIGRMKNEETVLKYASPTARKKIITTGFLKNASQYSGIADCFAMPSRDREGLPRAMIEAMIQKVCPIVTRIGGMPEVVRDNIDGLVVPAEDPKALAEAILKVANNPERRKQFAESAQQRILTSFKIDDTISKTIKVYQELLQGQDLTENQKQAQNF